MPATPSANNLKRLFVLRNIEVAGQATAVGIAAKWLDMSLPLMPMGAIIAALACLNLLTWLRLGKPWPVTDHELFLQLLADLAALAGLLYFSGGSTNPFVSLFLLPLTLAAAVLPWMHTWAMTALAVGCYSLLLFHFVPLPQPGVILPFTDAAVCFADGSSMVHGTGNGFELHVLGMWFNFVVSAALIAFFVVRMAQSIRDRDRLLAGAREATLRDERIVALGTLAAGAAHELGTPLSTMAVITKELQQEYAQNPNLMEDLGILRDQVTACKRILSNLLASANQARGENANPLPLDAFLEQLLDKWRLMRPGVPLDAHWRGEHPAPAILADQTLHQALMNLLNNAADASPEAVELEGRWDGQSLTVEILDRGPGLSPEAMHHAGKPFFTTKGPGQGIGIGLFLANATVERFGGMVHLFNREGGGTVTRVVLPLARLIPKKTP